MAKKRKAGTRQAAGSALLGDDDRRYKMTVRNYMDVANSEDEWDHEQDKLLLEDSGPARKRQRALEENDNSEEEIFSMPGSDDSDEEEEEGYAEDEMDGLEAGRLADSEDEKRSEHNLEGDDGWDGTDAYGADDIENEEEAKEMEAEALRLQKKHLAALTDTDFGFDETEWLGEAAGEGESGTGDANQHVIELLPTASISKDTPVEEKQRILTMRYPEFGPLAKEYLELRLLSDDLALGARDAISKQALRRERHRSQNDKAEDKVEDEIPTAALKYYTLSAYLASLAMYFAVFTSNVESAKTAEEARSIDPKELRDHSIMDVLIKQRSLWSEVRELSDSDGELTDSADEEDEEEALRLVEAAASDRSIYYTPVEQTFAEKYPALLKAKPKRKKLSKAEKIHRKAEQAAKAEREKNLLQLDKNLDELAKKLPKTTNGKTTEPVEPAAPAVDDDYDSDNFGDETTLTFTEAQEKERRRKSLRFYTSQIAQKANKSAAMRGSGGDADIPYRERLKDRVARLNAEAEARGRKASGRVGKNSNDDELGGDSDDEDRAAAAELRGENGGGDGAGGDDDGDDYYQTIASGKAAKKAAKEARHAALREAELRGAEVHEVEQIGADGKRAIGYTIEKNKGLTQRRRKDVRNPRVKKRKRFEDKKKKLASVRQVFKGGEGRGGYGGELTGIKKNLVRAVKL